jgi:hypothetical protein
VRDRLLPATTVQQLNFDDDQCRGFSGLLSLAVEGELKDSAGRTGIQYSVWGRSHGQAQHGQIRQTSVERSPDAASIATDEHAERRAGV